MAGMGQDLRYAIRSLRRAPVFTTVALLSLAIGIGANTAVFTIADQAALRKLPVEYADRLVLLTMPGPYSGFIWADNRFSYPLFRDLRDNAGIFENIAARFWTPLNLTYGGRSERIQAEVVSGAWFATLGLKTALGRGLTPEDDRVPGGHSVVVLTHDFWRSRFRGDRSVVNKVVLLNGHPMQVVGVAARGYHGFEAGERTDALVPTMMKAAMTPTWNGLDDRRAQWLQVVAKLRSGMGAAEAQARIQPFWHALLRIEAEALEVHSRGGGQEYATKPLILVPAARGGSDLRNTLSQPVRILAAMVGLLLAIACANVANLLLARAVQRKKEIAIRSALGAGRAHLMRQFLVESAVLGALGGALGLIVASWSASGLLGLLAGSGETSLSATFDTRVFAFTLAVSLGAALVFGATPAWEASSQDITGLLKSQGGVIAAPRGQLRARKALVISQVAISLVLLIAAALFTRSLRNLNRIDLGFERRGLLTFSVEPSLNGYSPDRIRKLAESIAEKLRVMPGARSAAVGVTPVIGDNLDERTVKIAGEREQAGETVNPYVDAVTPGYFGTLGMPLVAGRDFTDRDRIGAPRVAIVNEVFARERFAGRSAVGQRFGFGKDHADSIEIIGVARGAKRSRVDDEPREVVSSPLLQDPNPGALTVYVRAAGDPRTLLAATRRAIAQIDGALAPTGLRTMDDQVAEALSTPRTMAAVSICFGVAATLLAAIGVYGVMAYVVSRRTREIGIRSALGADRGALLRLVMREAGGMTAAGAAIAVPAALVLMRLARSQLYGVSTWDPLSVAAAVAVVAVAALAAGYAPAVRATRVAAASALRHE